MDREYFQRAQYTLYSAAKITTVGLATSGFIIYNIFSIAPVDFSVP
jgi:hypothetical protein